MEKKNSSNNFDWDKFKQDLDYLKSTVDPRYLVESLGFKISRETSKELRGICKIHNGDNPTSFRFNKEKRSWVCFSHKCHDIYGSDIIGLIRASLNLDFMAAVSYLRGLTGSVDINVDNLIDYRRNREKEEFIKQHYRKRITSKIVNETTLNNFRYIGPKLFNKYFDKGTMDFFEIGGGYVDSEGIERDVIPIRDEDGILLAYSLRDTREDTDSESKYLLTKDFDKDLVLYNLNNAIPTLEEKPLILVEGFKSVWKLYSLGINNVAAVMGSMVTLGQQTLIYAFAKKGIVIMFDNDIAGAEGAIKAMEAMSDKINVDIVFITEVDEGGKGLDPADLTNHTIIKYLKNYV